ncbi:hypothetical protein HK099_007275 [Clydaea vesicula]|uniref:Uncharacterized protein n=1 Tax=Clydaea vesicula TaxID=447962 RepID=A0AAD5TX94_9FUNG|nr:hypothetical protein HK099_007275 [Clydaea vesicula]KAJ3388533.1 hypothetical protein HDU92_001425 [Lobulomyces angularis]
MNKINCFKLLSTKESKEFFKSWFYQEYHSTIKSINHFLTTFSETHPASDFSSFNLSSNAFSLSTIEDNSTSAPKKRKVVFDSETSTCQAHGISIETDFISYLKEILKVVINDSLKLKNFILSLKVDNQKYFNHFKLDLILEYLENVNKNSFDILLNLVEYCEKRQKVLKENFLNNVEEKKTSDPIFPSLVTEMDQFEKIYLLCGLENLSYLYISIHNQIEKGYSEILNNIKTYN